ncbi:hypothetical protein M1D93_16860 [Arthrobacter sp. Z1-9]
MTSKTLTATTTALLALGLLTSQPANAADKAPNKDSFSFGVIGDMPYGGAEVNKFPARIQDLNADSRLDFVAHVGDIKNGTSRCTDGYFTKIREQFDTFEHPLVFTPGDNEWVDCHRIDNGAYNPLERLDKLREVFFDEPGNTLGAAMPVTSQVGIGLPENVRFTQNRVAFSVLNIQGSNNGLQLWTGLEKTTVMPEQRKDVNDRIKAAVQQIRDTFADAAGLRAVVLMTQADMFAPPTPKGSQPSPSSVSGFKEIVKTIIEETNSFDGPVYLINGDSHVFAADKPLAAGSKWLDVYNLPAADDLQRITVAGAEEVTHYVRFTASRNSASSAPVLSWKQVRFSR